MMCLAMVIGLGSPAKATPISPTSGSFTGTLYDPPLSQLYDEDFDSDITLRGTTTWNPTGHVITLNLGDDYSLTGINYLGDQNLGYAQGIKDYTLEFFLDSNSQGTFSESFANTTAWQTDTFNTVSADQVTLKLDSVYSGGAQWGSLSREIQFVPEPATLSLLALGGLAVLRRRRR